MSATFTERMEARTARAVRGQVRQGDVLFLPRRSRPRDVVRVFDEHGAPLGELAVGERHIHRLPRCRLYVDEHGRQFAFLERPESVDHQEHGAVMLAAGWWEVRRQRERQGGIVPRQD